MNYSKLKKVNLDKIRIFIPTFKARPSNNSGSEHIYFNSFSDYKEKIVRNQTNRSNLPDSYTSYQDLTARRVSSSYVSFEGESNLVQLSDNFDYLKSRSYSGYLMDLQPEDSEAMLVNNSFDEIKLLGSNRWGYSSYDNCGEISIKIQGKELNFQISNECYEDLIMNNTIRCGVIKGDFKFIYDSLCRKFTDVYNTKPNKSRIYPKYLERVNKTIEDNTIKKVKLKDIKLGDIYKERGDKYCILGRGYMRMPFSTLFTSSSWFGNRLVEDSKEVRLLALRLRTYVSNNTVFDLVSIPYRTLTVASKEDIKDFNSKLESCKDTLHVIPGDHYINPSSEVGIRFKDLSFEEAFKGFEEGVTYTPQEIKSIFAKLNLI